MGTTCFSLRSQLLNPGTHFILGLHSPSLFFIYQLYHRISQRAPPDPSCFYPLNSRTSSLLWRGGQDRFLLILPMLWGCKGKWCAPSFYPTQITTLPSSTSAVKACDGTQTKATTQSSPKGPGGKLQAFYISPTHIHSQLSLSPSPSIQGGVNGVVY